MNGRLPPLKALRAFEAAGRRGSFKLAADELGVTAGAVSRQIKALEDYLHVPLFERSHQEVMLTDESRAYLGLVSEIFQDLESVTNNVAGLQYEYALQVESTLTFATHWLVPRMKQFLDKYPEERVQLSIARMRNLPGLRHEADVIIQASDTASPGFTCTPLMQGRWMPVCSPALIKQSLPMTVEQMLKEMTVLDVNSAITANHWATWLETMQVDPALMRCRLELPTNTLTLQAAIEGMGVALIDENLASNDVKAGRLVCPVTLTADRVAKWYLVHATEAFGDDRVQRFCSWLRSTCSA